MSLVLDGRLPRRRPVRLLGRLGAGMAVALFVSSCHSPPPAAGAVTALTGLQTDAPAEASLLARIGTAVGTASCSSDTQCRTLPIGSKACGGPLYWLPWSAASAKADALQAWAAQLAALQRQRHAVSGIQSDCRYLPDPGAACIAQRCQLRDRY